MTGPALAETLRMEIKSRTREAHDALEALPISRAIVEETITREQYVGLLQQLLPVHEALEEECGRHDALAGVWNKDLSRSGYICGDLRALGSEPGAAPLLPGTRELIDHIRTISAGRVSDLMGILYVFEGSRLGSTIIYMHLGRALGLEYTPNSGLDYHMAGMNRLGPDFRRLADALDVVGADADARAGLIAAAEGTFERLHAFYGAL